MTKPQRKTKGHRFEKVKFHIPFYTTPFFDPDGELEEGETKTKEDKMVKIPMRIDASGDDSRANVTTWELKGISHFDNNIEKVLETLSQLKERVIQPRNIKETATEIKTTLQLMQLVCNSGPATQTLQEACRAGPQHVYDTYIADTEEENDEVQEDVLTGKETAFFEYLDGGHKEFDNEVHEVKDAYHVHLYEEFKRAFWNHLHSIIFGADAYKAFKQQKDYLLNKLIKPYGVTVEAAFRYIKVITSLMAHFPPPSSRGKTATAEQWEQFEEEGKKISSSLKREMKYNLLPESYQDCFNTLKVDWSEMTDHQKMNKAKETLKRKKPNDTDSVSTLSHPQKNQNYKGKQPKVPKTTTLAGVACMCELFKLSGAPEFVYTSHNTSACKKRDDYARKLSGSVGQRQKAGREARKSEKDLCCELKLLSRQVAKLKNGKRIKKTTVDDDNSSLSSNDSDE